MAREVPRPSQPSAKPGIWATKPAEVLIAETQEEGARLARVVGVLDLTALGVGAIVGTGVFVTIGQALADAGPAVVISFGLAALTCVFSDARVRGARVHDPGGRQRAHVHLRDPG